MRIIGNRKPTTDQRHTCRGCAHNYPAEVEKRPGIISGVDKCPRCGQVRPMTQEESQLAAKWLRLADRFAWNESSKRSKFSPVNMAQCDQHDLSQIAYLGLCTAAMQYREQNGCSFATVAKWAIRRAFTETLQGDQRFHKSQFVKVVRDRVTYCDNQEQIDAGIEINRLIKRSSLTMRELETVGSFLNCESYESIARRAGVAAGSIRKSLSDAIRKMTTEYSRSA